MAKQTPCMCVLLEATLEVEAEALARLSDLGMVANEELIDEDLVRIRGGDLGERLAVRAAHVACVHGQLDLALPSHTLTGLY